MEADADPLLQTTLPVVNSKQLYIYGNFVAKLFSITGNQSRACLVRASYPLDHNRLLLNYGFLVF